MAKAKTTKPVTKQDVRVKMLETCVWDAFGDHAGDEPDVDAIAETLKGYLEEEGFTLDDDQLEAVAEHLSKALEHEAESEMADDKEEEERCYAERDEAMEEAVQEAKTAADL
jgi:Asp-tRNA(Asn)/Glu-tRNA(Gln) amidotransferase A subunit family amidase